MMRIEGRSTRKGALTEAVAIGGDVSIREISRSRTGRHWEDEVELGDDGVVFVTDISNSGKHSCFVMCGNALEPLSLEGFESLYGELPCGLPARLHK
jgi:hypothetical protein